MYASKGTVEQVYSELFGDVDQITVERGSSVQGSVDGKLSAFISKIRGSFSGEVTETEIKSINFDDDMRRAKRLANELMTDEEIPDISNIQEGDIKLEQLYRFSCEVETKPFESEIDDKSYIRVTGEIGDIKFRGDTSTENWGLRSHIVQSVEAAKLGETYPYQGLMWPITKEESESPGVTYHVKFLIICGPERELMNRWYDRRTP
jgi:hypothetical protein